MAVEIERKFLIDKGKWKTVSKGNPKQLKQGYILTDPDKTIRIRIADGKGFITIKGRSTGATRLEYEYEVPFNDANEMLENFCENIISKLRYEILYEGKLWEVDVFLESNDGLIVAEIELQNEGELFALPHWISEEVTGIKKYYNSALSTHPFKNWKQ